MITQPDPMNLPRSHREPPIGGGFELFPDILGRHHGWIAGRLNVGCLENRPGLRARRR